MKKITFKDVFAYVDIVKSVNVENDNPQVGVMWFRGQDGPYPIKPGIFRDLNSNSGSLRDDLEELFKNEEAMINDFILNATARVPRPLVDGWEWIAVMQHRRLPTRLVDWTENALQALFFALSTWDASDDKHEPRVYILNSSKMNYVRMNKDPSPVFFAENCKLMAWLPETLQFFNSVRNHPVFPIVPYKIRDTAIVPLAVNISYVDDRMSRQSGCFTLHGSYYKSLNQYLEGKVQDHEFVEVVLDIPIGNYEVRQKFKDDLMNDLNILGVNDFSTYGDLDSLSKYLRKRFFNR